MIYRSPIKVFALEMAKEVAKHPHIQESKTFFGWCRRMIYSPTSSVMESYSNYYTEKDARLIQNLIDGNEQDIESNVEALADTESTPDASFRLDLCISHDSKFIAMQLNHVVDGTLTHITPIRYFEGRQAAMVDNLF